MEVRFDPQRRDYALHRTRTGEIIATRLSFEGVIARMDAPRYTAEELCRIARDTAERARHNTGPDQC